MSYKHYVTAAKSNAKSKLQKAPTTSRDALNKWTQLVECTFAWAHESAS